MVKKQNIDKYLVMTLLTSADFISISGSFFLFYWTQQLMSVLSTGTYKTWLPHAEVYVISTAVPFCFRSAMGGDPSHLNFGYVNYELNSSTPCAPESFEYETCILANLSCRLLHSLSKGHTFTLVRIFIVLSFTPSAF